VTLPESYRDPSPEDVAHAEGLAAWCAVATWARAMLKAINVDCELPLTDDVVARLGPAMPEWLAAGVARAQALRDFGELTSGER
jgi:hypothetical protein